jgi:hypothetical protein
VITTHMEPHEFRKGDRVRLADVMEFEFRELRDDIVVTANNDHLSAHTGRAGIWTRTWELIERPKPEPKLGSVWVDPEAPKGAINRFLYVGDYAYIPVQNAYGPTVRTFAPDDGDEATQLIARLVPAEVQA